MTNPAARKSAAAAVKAAQDRAASIAAAMYGALQPLSAAIDTETEMNEAAKEAKEQGVNVREQVMGVLADLAHTGAWSEAEINSAAVLMAKSEGGPGNKALPKTVQTFVGEAKRAMHPAVREHFDNIVSVRDEGWQAEVDRLKADKSAPAPIKKAFARKYHVLVTLLGEGAQGRFYETPEELVDFAKRRDPSLDADKTYKTLEKIREQLAAMVANFPEPDLVAGLDTLNKVTAKTLADSLERDEEPNDTAAGKPATVPSTTVVASDEGEVAEGAVDVLDDALAEAARLIAA